MDNKQLLNFEDELNKLYANKNILNTSINYSLLNGGKRIRPLLIFNTLESLGVDYKNGISLAMSLEMIHTYSLIHDDLPSMDNDDLRRGKISNHIKFSEYQAILAGDALNSDAFFVLSNSEYNNDIKVKLINLLSKNAGSSGMILGQNLDILAEGNPVSIEELKNIHLLKTAKLIEVCFVGSAIISKKEELIPQFIELSKLLGLIYQISDDILDITSTEEKLGKPINSDDGLNKSTYVSLLGLEQSVEKSIDLKKQIDTLLSSIPFVNSCILDLISKIIKRSS